MSLTDQELMSQLRRLLSEALDDEVKDEQAIKAAVAFVHCARTNGVTVNHRMALHTVVAERPAPRPKPEDYQQQPTLESVSRPRKQPVMSTDTTPMPFGKFKGTPLMMLVDREPGYCRWLLENAPNISPSLRSFFSERLDAVG